MAIVTIELRNLLKIKEFDLFDFNYLEIYPGFKKDFEQKFIDYYYFEEIGQETADRFKQRLKSKLNMILPRYQYEYQKMSKLNDLTLERLTRTFSKEHDSDTQINSQTNTQSNNENVNTDYPQYSEITSDIPSSKSLDSSTAEGIQQGTTDVSSRETITETINKEGGIKERLALLNYRNSLLEELIIELKTLFILVY